MPYLKYLRSIQKIPLILASIFSVCYADAPINLPDSARSHDYYGNSKTKEFADAIYGRSDDMTIEEKQYFRSLTPIKEKNRFYVKFAANLSLNLLSKFKLASSDAALQNALENDFSAAKFKKSSRNFQIGVGYFLDSFRIEGEYLYNKKIKFGISDDAGLTYDIQNSLQANNILLSGYYDFKELLIFKPYLGGSLGIGYNTIKVNVNLLGNLYEKKTRSIGLAYAINCGLRTRVMQRFGIHAGIRLLSNAKYKFKDTINNESIKINAKHLQLNYGLGVSYIF